jgi:hypothetical protein
MVHLQTFILNRLGSKKLFTIAHAARHSWMAHVAPFDVEPRHGEIDGAPVVLCQFIIRKNDAASLLRHHLEQTTPGDHLGPHSSLKINLRPFDLQFCAKLSTLGVWGIATSKKDGARSSAAAPGAKLDRR